MELIPLAFDEWDALVASRPDATIFHTSQWLKALERAYRCQVRWLGLARGRRVECGLAVPVRRKLAFWIAGARGMATPYDAVIGCEGAPGVAAGDVWPCVAQAGWDLLEVALPPRLPLDPWTGHPHVRQEVRRTIWLDLARGENALLRGLEASCRNFVRQAERQGVTVDAVDSGSSDWIDVYYRLAVGLYRRQHRPPAIPRVMIECLWAAYGGSDAMRVLFARHGDEVVAAGIFLVYRDGVYYWDGVSDFDRRSLRANNLLQWELIRWACRSGLRRYDMLGAGIPGIARFKKSFGGEYVPYLTFRWTRNWMTRAGEYGYRWLAPVARRVAAGLAR